jgi:hypothetical protein
MTGEQFNALVTEYGWVIAVSIVLFGFFAMLGKAWNSIVKFVKVVDILIDLPDKLQAIEDKIQGIEHEVTTNSGTSIKDAIKRIEERLNREA